MTPNLYFDWNKSVFALGQANLKCKCIWRGEKCTAFEGSFKPESVIIWSNIALNRSFCHFRYFGVKIWKKKHFGRFLSIKVKKTTKSLNLLEQYPWRRQGLEGDAVKLDKRRWMWRFALISQNEIWEFKGGRRQGLQGDAIKLDKRRWMWRLALISQNGFWGFKGGRRQEAVRKT